jgi:acetyltransferase-like isoleucine patch superfamily enzyme
LTSLIRKLYRFIDGKFPVAGVLLKRLYSRRRVNSIKKRITGSENLIVYSKAYLNSVLFDINGSGNRIEIEEGSRLNNVVFYIRGNNHSVKISENCIFNRGGTIWIEDSDCMLTIGENSSFEDVHLALTEPWSKITIGRDCLFANDIDVRTGDSHSILSQETNKRINFAEDVIIGNHVWVAAHVILLKGTHIPENSIIATGSVVTKQFEKEGIIIGGNPAKQLKEGITWTKERIFDN